MDEKKPNPKFPYRIEEIRYLVEVDGEPVAKDMALNDATILVRALFEEYWQDKKLLISIRRMDWE